MAKKIAIFASGSGTNAENIIRYFQENEWISTVVVLSNKENAYVLERARNLEIPAFYFSKKQFDEGDEILKLLQSFEVDLIVLAGFLLKVTEKIIAAYPGKIINIHPALLPKYGGKGMYGDKVHQAVVAAGETESGITIHHVNEDYDEGDIIFQATCPVLSGDTPDQVASRVHELEYLHFPRVIQEVISTL